MLPGVYKVALKVFLELYPEIQLDFEITLVHWKFVLVPRLELEMNVGSLRQKIYFEDSDFYVTPNSDETDLELETQYDFKVIQSNSSAVDLIEIIEINKVLYLVMGPVTKQNVGTYQIRVTVSFPLFPDSTETITLTVKIPEEIEISVN